MADNTILYGKWYFNDVIDSLNVPTTNLNFTFIRNEEIIYGIKIGIYSGTESLTYYVSDGSWFFPYTTKWGDEYFRTIVITSGGSDTFLTWLQANATKVSDSLDDQKTNKTLYEEQMNELVDVINIKANNSGSKTLSELLETAKIIVKPSGVINITVGGEHNVANYEKANVIFPAVEGEERSLKKLIDAKGNANSLFYNTHITTTEGLLEYSDTANAATMNDMFNQCSSLRTVTLFDTSKCTNMGSMFTNCAFETVPLYNTSRVTNMIYMFNGCTNLKEVPLFNTSKNESFYQMFKGCTSLTTVPLFDTSKATSMSNMFNNCTNLKEVPLFNLSNYNKELSEMFYSCTSLTTIPQFNTSKVTNMRYMFYSCTSLTSVPQLDTSKVTNMEYMFNGCTSLTTIEGLNLIKITNQSYVNSMFNRCTSLTNLTLSNIKVNLTIGSGSSYGHNLTIESLLNTCQECINVSASRTLTIGSANITKLADVYVKLTGEPEVDSTLPKLPMVQCESTDEGAMTIQEYMTLKNWTIA